MRGGRFALLLAGLTLLLPRWTAGRVDSRRPSARETDAPPTLGLEQGISTFETAFFELELVNASQTVAGLKNGSREPVETGGLGPTLLVVPLDRTPFEAYNPLLSDPTRRGTTFEGFYECKAHSLAYARSAWKEAERWNPPTSAILAPGESRSYITYDYEEHLRSRRTTGPGSRVWGTRGVGEPGSPPS